MNKFEKVAKEILKKHDCIFIGMISECRVLWRNKYGYVSSDDTFVLNNMGTDAWDFWSNYKPREGS